MKARFYAKDGTPVWDVLTWAKLFENYREYRRVAETILEDGTRISTIWLGIDHSFSLDPDAPPIIFETMVFDPEVSHTEPLPLMEGIPEVPAFDYHQEWDQERYSTEAQAIAGHEAMVKKWTAIREAWKNAGTVPEDASPNYARKYGSTKPH